MENNFSPKQLKPAYKFDDAGFGILAYIVLQFLAIQIASKMITSGVPYTQTFAYIFQFVIEAIFGVAVVIICSLKKQNIIQTNGLNKKVNVPLIALCFGVSLVVLFGLGNVSDFFMQLIEAIGYKPSGSSVKVETLGQLIINTLILAVAPAVCEELLFRGLMIGSLRKHGREFCVFVSAVTFMLMHGSPDQTVHQFILGVILGYIFYFTGNLWLTIIIHFFNNFIVLAYTFYYNITRTGAEVAEQATQTASTGTAITSYIISVAIIAVAVYLVVLLIKQLAKTNYQVNKTFPEFFTEADKKYVLEEAEQGENLTQTVENGADVSVTISTDVKDEGQVANPGDINEGKIIPGDDIMEQLMLEKEKRPNKTAIITLLCAEGYLIFEWIVALVEGFSR